VSTNDTLQQALEEQYVHTELLEAANQYRCGACDQLVDATRVCTSLIVGCSFEHVCLLDSHVNREFRGNSITIFSAMNIITS